MFVILPTTEAESSTFKEWLSAKHGHGPEVFPPSAYGYGVVSGDEILFAAVLEPFHHEGDILAHIYGADPAVFFSKGVLKEMFAVPYSPPFNARRVTLLIHSRFNRVVKVAERLGFEVEGKLKGHYVDDDAIILGAMKKDLEA